MGKRERGYMDAGVVIICSILGVFIIIVIAAFIQRQDAPCSLFENTSLRDIPARCIGTYQK